MSQVIINEFELVARPLAANGEGEAAAADAQPAANPPARSPVLEIERVARHHTERLLRIWAH